jgi:membrane protein
MDLWDREGQLPKSRYNRLANMGSGEMQSLKNSKPYFQINRFLRGFPDILLDTIQQFIDSYPGDAAASIAYYALFSIVPLLLFAVIAGSYFFEDFISQQKLFSFVLRFLPVSVDFMQKNIHTILDKRGAVSIVAAISLLWSGMGVFNALAVNINRAWKNSDNLSFLKTRLVALGVISGLGLLLGLTLAVTAAVELIPKLNLPIFGSISIYDTFLWQALSWLLPILSRLILFTSLYRWIPNKPVKLQAAFSGAVFSAGAWELITGGFTWYLSSGLARYELIYGSLGAVIALLFWVYLSSLATLFGAHLTAVIDQRSG